MENSFSSILLYTACGFLCLLLSCQAKKRPRLSFWLIVIALSLLSGLRKITVGVDTEAYVEAFELLKNRYYPAINNIREQGFLRLVHALMQLTGKYTYVLLAVSFITNYFIVRRLFEERENISLPIAIFIYFTQYFFMTFNTIRQWIAIAIVFYFSRYIGKKKMGSIIYCVAVAVAVSMHYSAIISLAYLAVYYLFVRNTKLSSLLMKSLIFLATPIGVVWLYNRLLDTYGSTYGNQSTGELSLINILRLLFLVALFILGVLLNVKGQSQLGENMALNQNVYGRAYENTLYILGIFLTLMVAFYSYADRIGQYFIVFEMLVLPRYAKIKWSKQVTIIFVIVIFSYLRIMSFLSNGYAELPYLPFWD